MKTFLIFLFSSLFVSSFAQENNFKEGNIAYSNASYKMALADYNKIIGAEKMSAALYYNLGNTYFQLNELGEAIWAYERALKINPSNENTRSNLKFANATTYDQFDTSNSGITHWLQMNLFRFSINFWAYISLGLSIMFAIALFFYYSTKKQKVKNRTLSLSFGSLFLLVLTATLAYFHKSNIINRTDAIVITEFVEVKSSPSDTAPEAFNLHEGTKIELLRNNENWTEISLNGNTGWVEKDAIWEI